jgi:conjugal transfer/entry exclusion protein
LTGEAKFQPLFRQLLDGESKLTAGFNEALSTVTTDVSAFETVAATTVQTPQARVVEAANLAETALNIQQSTDTEGQVRAAVGKIFADAMGATSVDMLTGLGSVGTRLTSPLGRTLDGPTGFGDSQIKELQNRIEYLQNANAPPAQIETAGAAIEAINKLLVLPERLEALKTNGDNVGAYLERQNKLMERTNELLEQSLNNQPSNAPNRLREMLRPEGQP